MGARMRSRIAAIAALALAAPAAAADWPAYRGPEGTGISKETGILKAWPEGGPKLLWRASLGTGYSGITAVDGRIYTMYGDGKDDMVACFDAATGKQVWKARIGANYASDQGDGPRSTPTVDGEVVYALGAEGQLAALKAASGGILWSKDLPKTHGARVPRWGVSTSPVVEGEMLLLDAGGREGHSLIALDKKSGETRWTAYSDKPGYSTPIVVAIGGVRQAISFAGTSLVGVGVEDGKVLWSTPWKTSYDVNAAMPVFVPPDKVFISSSYDVGAALYRVRMAEGKGSVEEVWRSRVMKNHFNSSILYGGHIYGFDNGTLKCIDAHTGEEKWGQRGFAKGSLVIADGHLIILSEHGLLALAEATPEAYREKARVQLLQGRTWTMPSLAGGRLYVRNQGELVALDLKG